MNKLNKFISLELLFAILLIAAFFMPWLDYGLLKKTGWEIPGFQKGIVKVSNFVNIFSKEKESEYTAYAVFSIPVLSALVCLLWIWAKQRAARVFLFITGLVGFAISLNLFYKLPKAGSGVYLLCGVSLLSMIYCFFMLKRKKKKDPEDIVTAE